MADPVIDTPGRTKTMWFPRDLWRVDDIFALLSSRELDIGIYCQDNGVSVDNCLMNILLFRHVCTFVLRWHIFVNVKPGSTIFSYANPAWTEKDFMLSNLSIILHKQIE